MNTLSLTYKEHNGNRIFARLEFELCRNLNKVNENESEEIHSC
jgi:hypothetical protein